jgi:hypothetical protein
MHFCLAVCTAGPRQTGITQFTVPVPRPGGDQPEPPSNFEPPMFIEPPPFGSKAEAALYTPSAPWLTDVFLKSTEKDRE